MFIENQIPDIKKEINENKLSSLLESNYSTIGPAWVNCQMQWMNGIYAAFNNHDKFLIVIYLLNRKLDFYSRNFIKLTYDECYQVNIIEINEFNVTEISKALNIPKESARRKINELEDMGVIKRSKRKILIDRSSYTFIKPENTIRRISRFLASLSKICGDNKILTKSITSEQLEVVIKENFSYIWKIYYDMQIPMMLSYKEVFKDLEKFHVFGTCAVSQHLHIHKLNKNTTDRNDFLKLLTSKKVQGINAMSISDITGIPRATVIRKLQQLIKSDNLIIDDKKLYKLSETSSLKKSQKAVLNNLAKFSTKVFNFELLK